MGSNSLRGIDTHAQQQVAGEVLCGDWAGCSHWLCGVRDQEPIGQDICLLLSFQLVKPPRITEEVDPYI